MNIKNVRYKIIIMNNNKRFKEQKPFVSFEKKTHSTEILGILRLSHAAENTKT